MPNDFPRSTAVLVAYYKVSAIRSGELTEEKMGMIQGDQFKAIAYPSRECVSYEMSSYSVYVLQI